MAICENTNGVMNRLFYYSTTLGDGFRQYFYPNLPTDYRVNQEILDLVNNMVRDMYDETEIVMAVLNKYNNL